MENYYIGLFEFERRSLDKFLLKDSTLEDSVLGVKEKKPSIADSYLNEDYMRIRSNMQAVCSSSKCDVLILRGS
ncbi:hypothetical protein KY330_04825 [Candidatus Woesearchaeota archaeon]|nr:hypothetical protein [Candidatus Woesearchaeota archaeon]